MDNEAAEVRSLVDEVGGAIRAFKEQYNAALTKADARIDEVEKAVDQANIMLQARQMFGGNGSGTANPNRTVAAALHDNASMAALRDGKLRSALVPLGIGVKAAITGDGANPYPLQPQRQPGIQGIAQRPLTVLDLLPAINVNAGSFEFNRIGAAFANAADYQVAQGDTKATQAVPVDLVTVPIATVAAITAASEQVLSDEPSLQARIGDLLRYGVRAKLEAELVAGAGGTGKITGLTQVGAAFTAAAGEAAVDRISECAAALSAAGWRPSAIVMNPADWHAIRTAKADTAGVYLAGSYDQPATPNVWGLPLVQSAALAAGSAIVADFAQCALLDRRAIAVQVGYVGDQFAQNLLTIRAELRAGLAVFAPSAVRIVSLA